MFNFMCSYKVTCNFSVDEEGTYFYLILRWIMRYDIVTLVKYMLNLIEFYCNILEVEGPAVWNKSDE
jgi:hypothetical protein